MILQQLPAVDFSIIGDVLGLLPSVGLLDGVALLAGFGIIPVLTILFGGRLGMRGTVFFAALLPVDRWVGVESGSELRFHRARETKDGFAYCVGDEWVEFEVDEGRWSKLEKTPFTLVWAKSEDAVRGSAASDRPEKNRWIKDDCYVIDAAKEFRVLQDADDPRLLDDVQEEVLRTHGGGRSMNELYRAGLSLASMVLGGGLAVVVLAV